MPDQLAVNFCEFSRWASVEQLKYKFKRYSLFGSAKLQEQQRTTTLFIRLHVGGLQTEINGLF